ncbi:MAG: helix-turn-helix domain-containing protein [Cyclobacteriaceae bacterium]
MYSTLRAIKDRKEMVIVGAAIILVAIALFFSFNGAMPGNMSPEEQQLYDELTQGLFPTPGIIFLTSLIVHFCLLLASFTLWYNNPTQCRRVTIVWLGFVAFLMITHIASFIYFPVSNPLLFNWPLKCRAFAILSGLSLVIGLLMNVFISRLTKKTKLKSEETEKSKRYAVLSSYPNIDQHLRELMERTIDTIHDNIANENLDCQFLADELYMSEATLRRRIDDAIGKTPGVFIRDLRLAKARELESKGSTASYKELAVAVGFKSPTYFMKLFREHEG